MISRIISRTVDLSAVQKVEQLEGPLYQLEEAGHTFQITCLMDGEAASLSGTVSARFLRSDETTVYFTGSLSDNVATITLPQSCYTVTGRFGMVVFITGSDVTSAIYAVAGNVCRSTSDTVVDPADEVPSLEGLLAIIDDCETATTNAETAATNANTVADSVSGDISELYTSIARDTTNIFTTDGATTGQRLKISTLAAASNSSFSISDYYPIAPEDIIILNWHLGSGTYGHVFYDSSKTAISGVTSASINPIIAPSNSAYVRFTYITADAGDCTLRIISPGKNQAFATQYSNEDTGLRQDICYATDGHVRLYECQFNSAVELYEYDADSSSVTKNATSMYLGTVYIKIPTGSYVYLLVHPLTGTYTISGTQPYITCNFYNSNREIDFDIYQNIDASTNYVNRYRASALLAEKGMMFSGFDSDCYLRVGESLSSMDGAALSVVVWDGTSVGSKVYAYPKVFEDTTAVTNPDSAISSLQIPSNACLCLAKPGYTFMDIHTASSSVVTHLSDYANRVPAQIVWVGGGMANYSRSKNIAVVKGYDYTGGTYETIQLNGDISDYVSIIYPFRLIKENPTGWAMTELNVAKSIMDVQWECQSQMDAVTSGIYFKAGVTYCGIPYRSVWTSAHFFGWHITKHTFINAANDPDSIFYNSPEASVKQGPYYSLVCSSLGSLISGFSYPVTNYSMMRDPKIQVTRESQYETCTLHTNGYGHCVVPLYRESDASSTSDFALQTYIENGSPTTRMVSAPTNILTDWKGIGLNYQSGRNFFYKCYAYHSTPPYNIEDGTITNGSARPFRGDGSVYTSAMDVVINIKDGNATRLYYQKFTVTTDSGMITSATASGDPSYISITAGTTQVTLRTATSNGTFTGANLEDGAVYGVWASVDAATTIAPDNTEYFEWRDVETNSISFSVSDGTLVTDDEFWYAMTSGHNYQWWVNSAKKGGNFIIPYQAPGYNADGTQQAHSDYSNYAEYALLTSANSVKAFFRKGTLGAYVVGSYVSDDYADDDEPD